MVDGLDPAFDLQLPEEDKIRRDDRSEAEEQGENGQSRRAQAFVHLDKPYEMRPIMAGVEPACWG